MTTYLDGSCYLPNGIGNPDERYDYGVYGSRSDDSWHINYLSMGEPTERIICAVCGGDKFEVGIQDYATIIRCVTCRWELIIHEG